MLCALCSKFVLYLAKDELKTEKPETFTLYTDLDVYMYTERQKKLITSSECH